MNKTIIFKLFEAYAKSLQKARVDLVKGLRANGITTVEQARPLVLEWASIKTGCPLVEGRGKAAGRMVLDSTHEAYDNAKQTVYRTCEAFKPKNKAEPSERKEVDAVAALIKKFEALTPAQKRAFKAAI